jgi:hypothetical protein
MTKEKADALRIERFRPEDAAGVAGCARTVHGDRYPHTDIYDPGSLTERNLKGEWTSFVVLDPGDTVVGHLAFERLDPADTVVELGMLMVIPEYRGLRLHPRLVAACIAYGVEIGLDGYWSDTVASDSRSQRPTLVSPLRSCGLSLNLWPRRSTPGDLLPCGRESYLFNFRYIAPPQPVLANVPRRHRDLVAATFEQFGTSVTFDALAQTGPGEPIETLADPPKGCAFLRAHDPEPDIVDQVRSTLFDLDRADIHATFLDLPLAHPETPRIASSVESFGFFYSGVCPSFLRGADALRLQRIRSAPEFEAMEFVHPFAERLRSHVRAEYERVFAHRAAEPALPAIAR